MKYYRPLLTRISYLLSALLLGGVVVAPSAFATTTGDYTWTNISTTDTATHGLKWHSLASSASGQHLLAGLYLDDVWTSSDYGTTWTNTTTANSSMHGYNWQAAASDATGQHLALAAYNGDIWTSSDYGAHWADVSTGHAAITNKTWFSLDSSATGQYLVGVVLNGDIYTSNDYGATWTDVSTSTATNTHGLNWITISVSGTGQYQAANVLNGGVWISNDYGATWTESAGTHGRNWAPVRMSVDGRHIVDQVNSGDIYTGVNTDIQDSATVPNTDDANGDSQPDSTQGNVRGSINPVTNKYALIQAGSDCAVSSQSVAAVSTQDASYTYPAGLMDFTLQGCGAAGYTTTVTQYYYGVSGSNFVLRKYNPTTKQYATVNGATITHTVIDGQDVMKASYQVTDGGPLDEDGTANGVIVDPAGLAAPVAGTLADTGSNVALTAAFAGGLIVLAAATRYSFRRR